MNPVTRFADRVGRHSVGFLEEAGYLAALLAESLYWLALGPLRRQPVHFRAIFAEGIEVGVSAIPIIALASFAIGVMLAIQGIYTLREFGAENQVVLGVALSVTREFAPLITGIFVAGRSGSAIAARIGTMQISQEIDALSVIGINPVRFLVSPLLAAMLLTVPALTVMANLAALTGAALYCAAGLNLPPNVFLDRTFDVLKANDVMQGIYKSFVFATLVTLIGAANGFLVKSGAEGVGRATTRSVVLGAIAIILADMVFTWFLSR